MDTHEHSVLALAEIARGSVAMNQAALVGDFEEVRFHAILVASKAEREGMADVALAADDPVVILGPAGSQPNAFLGEAMVRVAELFDRVDIALH